MNTRIIRDIIKVLASKVGHEIDPFKAGEGFNPVLEVKHDTFDQFLNALVGHAGDLQLNLVVHAVTENQLRDLLGNISYPILAFQQDLTPILFEPGKQGQVQTSIIGGKDLGADWERGNLGSLFRFSNSPDPKENGKVLMITAYPMVPVVSESPDTSSQAHKSHDHAEHHELSPVKRLFKLFGNETKDIGIVYVYAIAVGLINLSLPLGIQAIIGLISGGLVFNSVVVLISLVIIGIMVAGGLQIMQITLVEVLQRRVFARAAIEFAYRIPRFKMEALGDYYPPELMNRFFDVVTVQKGIPKLMIDLTAAVLSILFGLLLLAFYHPFFVFFGLVLLGLLILMFYITGGKGLKSSIMESKYKYKTVNWFQEMARSLIPFKLAGASPLPMRKTDGLVNQYLKYRKKHFEVLISQYSFILIFKTVVTGGLLIIGTALVVDRQISLGQFVASEVIIITIVGAVEKIILSMDVVYDMLTGVDKIGHVTDVPLERGGGIKLSRSKADEALTLHIKGLHYTYPGSNHEILRGIDLDMKPGESLALSGGTGSGKHTFVKVLLGILTDYSGSVAFNGISLRDADLQDLRGQMGENILDNPVFDGSILDNLVMGRTGVTADDIPPVLEALGVAEYVYNLPHGLQTPMFGDHHLPETAVYKLKMARAVLAKPRFLVIDDTMQLLPKAERLRILSYLLDKKRGWTMIAVSNDAVVRNSCDRALALVNGRLELTPIQD